MKSITIHNLEDSLDSLIREKAKKQGLSLNKTIQLLLKKALGLSTSPTENNDFLDFVGVWSKNDEKIFNKNIQSLNEINKLDWE